MYKLLAFIFLLLVILAGSAKSLDLSIYKDGFYIRYEFPRFSEKTWFEMEFGSRRGFAGIVDDWQAKVADSAE